MYDEILKNMEFQKLLECREHIYHKKMELAQSGGVISLSVNIPGSNKTTDLSNKIFKIALKDIDAVLLKNKIAVIRKYVIESVAGYIKLYELEENSDYYFIKRLCIDYEENSEVGRLIDLDVMTKSKKLISRKDLNIEERRCFLCNKSVSECVGKHNVFELVTFFNSKASEIIFKEAP